ncbi:hypothetical protein LY76DRAFT_298382 [Colletotrichum caudatum]|nr:hypothetical protein LY76DRAFT_298382 [Colletotrichum caudatum]
MTSGAIAHPHAVQSWRASEGSGPARHPSLFARACACSPLGTDAAAADKFPGRPPLVEDKQATGQRRHNKRTHTRQGWLPAQIHLNTTYASPHAVASTRIGVCIINAAVYVGTIPPPAPSFFLLFFSFAFWPARGGSKFGKLYYLGQRAPVCQVLSAGRAVGHMPDPDPVDLCPTSCSFIHLLSAKGPAAGTP